MTRLVIGTDGTKTSEQLANYLQDVIDSDDELYFVNSQVGGDNTTAKEIQEGEEALEVLEQALSNDATVQSDQFVLGNEPVEDFLRVGEEWDADEFVIGIRKHSPVGKVVFGSTAQNLLLEADRPVRCVPLV